MSFLASAKALLKEHKCLYLIVGCCGLSCTFSTIIITHSIGKYGTYVGAGWMPHPKPQLSVAWDRPSQFLITLRKSHFNLYKDDKQFKSLLGEIYADNRYDRRKSE